MAELSENTEFGFTWDDIEVTRYTGPADRENKTLRVIAGNHRITIYISRTASRVRVWKNGKELK